MTLKIDYFLPTIVILTFFFLIVTLLFERWSGIIEM